MGATGVTGAMWVDCATAEARAATQLYEHRAMWVDCATAEARAATQLYEHRAMWVDCATAEALKTGPWHLSGATSVCIQRVE
ncbi:hypothetical protein [Mycobacterium tuberculosis]|uniref:hypothetical protein n=1 Tax=Mycobacterium tuberculosis TaxID=1773 RepID=UPI00272C4C5E|nr:hypothetical protein [Mycobacterium tuberculosis]